MYFYYNVSWRKEKNSSGIEMYSDADALFKCPSEERRKNLADDKGGFLINVADSADRLCCNSSTSNHKYNEKKRQE